MLPLDRLWVHNARERLWRWVVDEIVRAPLEPILHPSTVRLQWLGLFTFGGHFMFAWLWGRLLPQPYEIFSVRVGLAVMGLLLLLKRVNRDLTGKASVWVFGIMFWTQLPMYFGWMYLMNEGNKVWLASVCAMILIYYHITDWRLATLGTVTGFGVAAGLFMLTRTDQAWLGLDIENLTVMSFAWVMSIMLGMSGANLRRVRLLHTLSTMGVMAHELRTPLASVSLMGDVLRAMAQDDVPEAKRKKLHELAAKLQNMVRSMNRQIDTQISNAQLLRLPRLSSRIMAFELVQDVVAQYPYRSPRERDCVTLDLNQDFCFLGSRAQFSQVLVNLIKNALHALAAANGSLVRGDLHIAVEVRHNSGWLTVSDKGTGIPLTKQQRVFEPFFSLQSSVGNGLGLSFCKNVVEAADGRLSLRSDPPHGAVFMIELPLAPHNSAQLSPDTA